jgi:hypothetical protein
VGVLLPKGRSSISDSEKQQIRFQLLEFPLACCYSRPEQAFFLVSKAIFNVKVWVRGRTSSKRSFEHK